MQPVSRRVRTIYSVVASLNRLEILRILNTKGPLSYSELKTLAGFKSKKESGKFAYHLRKLVKQMLISLNRQDRKYTVTSLGRLILNLTRQIEEQSIVESGKLYVRTSRQTMEEFNSDKILQSLVREAGVPVELAQRITSETEARLYKFQTIYLTAPLIREMVNALLIEHGLEEYRHKLTRLGLPIYDIAELINNTGQDAGCVDTVLSRTAHRVFSEYLMLSKLPRDVTDAHLAGEIHISNSGSWGLMPDTVFFDLKALQGNGINPKGRLLPIPRMEPPKNLEEAVTALVILISIFSRESSTEVVLENFTPYLAEHAEGRTVEELRGAVRRAFTLIPSTLSGGYRTPLVSLQIGVSSGSDVYDEALIDRLMDATFSAYQDYVSTVPFSRIGLVAAFDKARPSHLKAVASLVNSGGLIAFSSDPGVSRAFSGLRRDGDGKRFPADGVAVMHSLALNLPRLAYESNRDETYFRAKLAILLQTAISALSARRKIVSDVSKKGLLPALTSISTSVSEDHVPLVMNLTGLNESVSKLIGERSPTSERRALIGKILETAAKTASESGGKIGETTYAAVLQGEASARFASIDLERYGRSAVAIPPESTEYSQIPMATPADISKADFVEGLEKLYQMLAGGCSVAIETPKNLPVGDLSEIIDKASKCLRFFKVARYVAVCRSCGSKYPEGTVRCGSCRSTSMMRYSTI